MIDNNEWFVSWFDSKYYHILYSDRTDYEAHNFIYQLKNHLSLDSKEKVLDLGCGRGRHSKTLSEFFKTLDGIDISKENIDFATSNKSKNQNFYLSDMRNFKMSNSYGYIFNLFTSFGYFDELSDNVKVLENCNHHLKKNGLLIIDFLNAKKIKKTIKNIQEIKTISNIIFEIDKYILNNYIFKKIKIIDGDSVLNFVEKVQLFELDDFIKMLEKTGFTEISAFGDYKMNPYRSNSNRLILCAKKR
ncbi:MAG: class I SAM-dependent methyltransferase [Crocinitomicaceae bacterium TMED135]|nr:MAG: class I SAM-dependent methyltransferase [Crocinitomicaceae bacterium TMED135]